MAEHWRCSRLITLRDVILLLLLLLLLFFVPTTEALRCYSCSFSFNEMYDAEHRDAWCANESLVQFNIEETSKLCASWEKFCITQMNTINKAFTSVSRGCGERCSELCESIGYGQDQVNCDDCCEEDFCNANFSVIYYQSQMERQYTSWETPLPGELTFNRAKNIKFPYNGAPSIAPIVVQLLPLLFLLPFFTQ